MKPMFVSSLFRYSGTGDLPDRSRNQGGMKPMFVSSLFHVGARTWPCEYHRDDIDISPNLPTHHVRQAIISFDSGWRASVIWGTCTYSSNNWRPPDGTAFTDNPEEVEVAVYSPGGVMIRIDNGETVAGWVSAHALNELLDLLEANALTDVALDTWNAKRRKENA